MIFTGYESRTQCTRHFPHPKKILFIISSTSRYTLAVTVAPQYTKLSCEEEEMENDIVKRKNALIDVKHDLAELEETIDMYSKTSWKKVEEAM